MINVKRVLKKLQENGLLAKLDKSTFHTDTIDFLGFVISPQGIQMDPKKTQALVQWPSPGSVKEVHSFLGFANFYRRFIDHFSDTITPITRLLKKGTTFSWTEEAEKALFILKNKFTSASIIHHADNTQPFFLEADASQQAVGAVLSQRGKSTGQLHPVA